MKEKKTYKKPGQLKAYLALAWYSFRAQTRNPASFAFGFIFPIVFISIFGLIGGSPTKVSVGVADKEDLSNPVIQAMSKQPYIKVETRSKQELTQELKRGKIAAIIDPETTGAQKLVMQVTYSSALQQESASVRAVLNSIVDKTNLTLSGVTNPPVVIAEQAVSGRRPRYIDFALPGQIGFSLLSTAIFGTVFGLIYLKKAGILKRMFATPTKALTILLAQGTSRLILALLQTVLILSIGVLVFKFYLPFGWVTFFELLILSTFGLIAFLGFGYFLAGIANDENSAGPLVNLVTLPQFLLSGTFFPVDSLPTWLQPIANNLPLSYFNLAIRHITTEGGTLVETWPYLLGLSAWGIVMYLLAARTFRWS